MLFVTDTAYMESKSYVFDITNYLRLLVLCALVYVVITFAELSTFLQCLGHDFTTEVCKIKIK